MGANARDSISDGNGNYDWDGIDGYDELNDHPEVQKKIRRTFEQGHVDAADFRGDPEKLKLGEKGIHLTKAQLAKKEKDAAKDAEEPKKPKRGRKKEEADDDEEQAPKPKKARKSKVKAEEEAEEKPAPAKRGRKAIKAEEGAEEEKPAPAKR